MKLAVKQRDGQTKKVVKEIRRAGNIPAILYSSKNPGKSLTIDGETFRTALRHMAPGGLPTTVFTLVDEGQETRAIVKDIQYHPTTYAVNHLDFVALQDNTLIRIKVPVNCVGVADCVGIKLGGFLRQVVRYVTVECLPKHIPAAFTVDVQDLGIRQTRRLKDLVLPQGVTAVTRPEEVLVVIAKR
jgi:large subunit ribosomal protein L25